jgi:predicted HAD superfamily phosphohydrolase YqeG
MRPTWHLAALAEVDAAFLAKQGIRGIIWDVDGTLTGDRRRSLDDGNAAAFRALLAMPGLAHVVLSNAGEERYAELSGMFPGMPILRAYTEGNGVLYRRRQGADDSWTAAELEKHLADGARVIRKPSRVLVDYAIRELGIPQGAAVMIGDQYLTDVAGANLGGVRSIKLPTLARETFRTSVRFTQRLELVLYALLYGAAKTRGRGRE